MFLSRNKKINVYPCKPQFYHMKVGFKGGQNYIGVFSWCLIDISLFVLLWLKNYIYNRLSLSRSPRDSLKYFDIHTSIYQISRTEEKINRTTTFHKRICNLIREVRDIYWKYCEKEKKLLSVGAISRLIRNKIISLLSAKFAQSAVEVKSTHYVIQTTILELLSIFSAQQPFV